MSATKKQSPTSAGSPERLICPEAEQLIIGNILSQEFFFKTFCASLTEDCFAVEQYRRVYHLAKSIHEAGRDPILSECLLHAIIARGENPDETGLGCLTDLAYDAIELTDPAPWIRTLKHKAAERRLWRVGARLQAGVESGIDATAELCAARDELRAIEANFDTSAVTTGTIADAVASIGVDTLLAAPAGVIAYPYATLTELTNGGLRRGELCVVASRPGIGKSTSALQLSLAAAEAGHRVLLVSLEMTLQDLLKRAISAQGKIPHGVLVRGDLDRSWRSCVAETLSRIGDFPLEINDKLRTLPAIVSKVASNPGLELLVIDYLGLVDPGGRFENRNQEISAISRQLKLLALDYKLPVVALHQLSRANETANRRPQLSDLRDSGTIEQDCDVCLLFDAPDLRKHGNDGDRELLELQIAKQRNGVVGNIIPLRLEGRFCRMKERDQEKQSGGQLQ